MPGVFRILMTLAVLLGAARVSVAQPQDPRPPHLETPRFGMPAVTVKSSIYVVGGGGPIGPRSDVERIEVTPDGLKISVQRPKLMPRVFHSAEARGFYIYVFGGVTVRADKAEYTTEVERLDTRNNTVEWMASMPVGLRTPASAVAGDKIYVLGGSDAADVRVNTLLIYDVPSDTWEEGAPMPEKKECDLIPWKDGLLAIGGFDGKTAVRGVHYYDIAKNEWTACPPLTVPTSAHHAAVVGEKVVIFGDYAQMNRVLAGDPIKGDWRVVEESGFSPARHAAVAALGTDVYVIGGNTSSAGSILDSIQRFEAEKVVGF